MATDEVNDLALLKITATGLPYLVLLFVNTITYAPSAAARMREATTKAMPAIVEEERQSRQGRPAGAGRAGGLQEADGSGEDQDRVFS